MISSKGIDILNQEGKISKDKKSLRNLKEAQPEAESTDVRYSHEEVFSDLRSKLIDRVDGDNT